MTGTDRRALQRAIKMTRAESPDRDGQISRMMSAGRSFEEIGQFAAYHCQHRILRLRPWETAPCDAGPHLHPDATDTHGYRAAAELLERMLAAGLSRWDPDPVAALEGAENRRSEPVADLPATSE
jgi:hypothetical protein